MHIINALHKANAEDHGPAAVPLHGQLNEIYNHPGDTCITVHAYERISLSRGPALHVGGGPSLSDSRE